MVIMSSKPIDISGFRHLYPFKSHYMDLKGLKYHYLDEGRGNPLLMLHGNPTWSFYYRELIKALGGHYRCIVPDHMGCGLSDRPPLKTYDYRLKTRVDDVDALMNALTFDTKITLVLHDWGGMIGMAWALRHPEKIGRLVILNTAAFLPPCQKRIPLRLSVIRRFTALAAPAVLGLNLFAVAALYMASYKGLDREVKKALTAPYNSWQNRIATLKFVQDIPLAPGDPSYELARQTDEGLAVFSKLPTLICWGQHDFVFDRSYLNEWQRRFPEAEVHSFAEAGHYVLEDVPEKIISRVQDFLQRHPL